MYKKVKNLLEESVNKKVHEIWISFTDGGSESYFVDDKFHFHQLQYELENCKFVKLDNCYVATDLIATIEVNKGNE